MILSFISRNKVKIISTSIGALAGFLYYFFIGCANGSCLIASNPFVSVPYFAVLGYLLGGIIKK